MQDLIKYVNLLKKRILDLENSEVDENHLIYKEIQLKYLKDELRKTGYQLKNYYLYRN